MLDQTQRWVSYKAYIKDSGRKCLLKRYLIDKSTGLGKVDGWEEQFQQIINELTKIDLPSLRSVIEGGIDPLDGNPYVVYEWFEVSSLKDLLKDGTTLGKDLTEQLSSATLSTLNFMHNAGCMHGGLNPDTIYFTDSKEKNPWVVDWDPIRSMRCYYNVNRFPMDDYTAAELLSGESASIQTDLYSLGKIAQKSLGKSPDAPALHGWIKRLLKEGNSAPFKTAEEARQALPSLGKAKSQSNSGKPTLIVGGNNAPAPAAQASHSTAGRSPNTVSKSSAPAVKKPSHKGAILTITLLTIAILGLGSLLLFTGKKPAEKERTSSSKKLSQDRKKKVKRSQTVFLRNFSPVDLNLDSGQKVAAVGIVDSINKTNTQEIQIRLKRKITDNEYLTLIGNSNFKIEDLKELKKLHEKKRVKILGHIRKGGGGVTVLFSHIKAL